LLPLYKKQKDNMEKTIIVIIIAIAFLFLFVSAMYRELLPVDRCIDWTTAGIPGGFKDYAVSVNVMDFGAKADGVTDDYKAFSAAIEAAKDNSAVLIPSGSYMIRSPLTFGKPIVLRGEGMDRTHIVFDFAGNPASDAITAGVENRGVFIPVVSGFEKGSTALAVSGAAGFKAGSFAEILQDNDPAAMYTSPDWKQSWAQDVVGQLFKVVKVEGNIVTIDEPLHISYKKEMNVRIRPVAMVEGAGIEDLHLKRNDKGDGCMIALRYAAYSRVRQVGSEYILRSHVSMGSCYKCLVEKCVMHHAHDYGGGGHGYGVELNHRTCNCLVENNTFYHLRHSMMVHLGANGNVFGYNTSTDPIATGDHDPNMMICDISIHGHYPFMNLFEGNRVQKITISDYWGPSGPGNTFYRNIVEGENIIVNEKSPYQNIIGNKMAKAGCGIKVSSTVDAKDLIMFGNIIEGGYDAPIPGGKLPDSLYKRK
jgi:hypothetical protein